MNIPPDYMTPLFYAIEQVVIAVHKEFPKLADKEVEFAYEQLKAFFIQKSRGKTVEEPLSTLERKQVLMDEILNALEAREEEGADDDLIMNKDIQPDGRPIPSLEVYYASALNRLVKSERTWRKRGGYLKYIRENLPH